MLVITRADQAWMLEERQPNTRNKKQATKLVPCWKKSLRAYFFRSVGLLCPSLTASRSIRHLAYRLCPQSNLHHIRTLCTCNKLRYIARVRHLDRLARAYIKLALDCFYYSRRDSNPQPCRVSYQEQSVLLPGSNQLSYTSVQKSRNRLY